MSDIPGALLDSLLVETKERCKALERRARTLVHSEFASENPKLLIRLFGRIAHELSRFLGAHSPPKLADLRVVNDLVCELGAHLRYAEAALSTRVPWSLPLPLEDLLKRFLPDATVMLRPQWHHNFSIIMDDLGEYYRQSLQYLAPPDRQDLIFADFPSGFHIISFPSIERMNVLLHCDLAHELGHLVGEQFFRQESNSYIREFTDAIRAANPGAATFEIQSKLNEAILIRRRALEELGADAFAVRCLGPAAFLALASILAADDLDQTPEAATEYYPPGRYRLREALRFLRQLGLLPKQNLSGGRYGNLLEYFSGMERFAARRTDAQALARGGELVVLAYDSARKTIPKMRKFLQRTYGSKFLGREQLYRETQELVDRLVAGVPPNEVRSDSAPTAAEPLFRAAPLEAILNAAWLYRMTYLARGSEDSAPNGPRDIRALSRLTLKAIEFARVAADYAKWSNSRGSTH